MSLIDARQRPEDVSIDANPSLAGEDHKGHQTPQTGTWADSPLGERLCDNVPLVSMTLVAALLGSLMLLAG